MENKIDNLNETRKKSWFALLPIAVFLVFYLGTSIIFKDFYIMSVVVAFLLALIVALVSQPKVKFDQKLTIMARGVGDKNIVCMILIFLLSGIFAGVLGRDSASSAANLLLTYIPAKFAPVIIFVIAGFISTAMGTSVGTIVVVGPIACSIAAQSSLPIALLMACVIGGAMFGDNLSFISDTTIAANTTQGSIPKKKFMENLIMAIPACVVTLIILFIYAFNTEHIDFTPSKIDLLLLIPYVVVLIASLVGINVFIVLGVGIVLSIFLRLISGVSASQLIVLMGSGASGMFETILVAILVAMLSELMKHGGGFNALLDFIKKVSKGKVGAQFGIAGLVTLTDVACANNTVAIVMSAPLAKEISEHYDISSNRSAAVLDIFGSVVQGLIPYGAQMLYALSIANTYAGLGDGSKLNVLEVIQYNYYLYFLAISAICFIIFVKPKSRVEKKSM